VQQRKPREIAYRALLARGQGEGFIEDMLDAELAASRVSSADRSLAQELAYGVVRWQAPLDWLVELKSEGRPQRPEVQILLRLGLYQLFWLDRVPDHAAVFETVALAGPGPAPFVNAVLRGYLREREATRAALDDLKHTDPAWGWSHPAWLVQRWTARWGAEATARLLEWNNLPARTFARVNTLVTEPAKLIERWRDEDVLYDFRRYDWTPESLAFELKSHPPLGRLDSLRQGWFYLQDPSTLLAPWLLDPKPGDRILDLCAAPGGKTTMLAQMVENDLTLVAVEPSASRRERLLENCTRLCAECTAVPSLGASPVAEFDRALVDAPCSNTGVIRRRLDLRWRVRLEEIERLRRTQLGLLEQAAGTLRPGGVVVYSTCSLEPEENRGVVDAFIAAHPDFTLERDRELFPPDSQTDGAYAAALRKAA
jgi:16S rRNA (cytosine967-C5)-methyltransferase